MWSSTLKTWDWCFSKRVRVNSIRLVQLPPRYLLRRKARIDWHQTQTKTRQSISSSWTIKEAREASIICEYLHRYSPKSSKVRWPASMEGTPKDTSNIRVKIHPPQTWLIFKRQSTISNSLSNIWTRNLWWILTMASSGPRPTISQTSCAKASIERILGPKLRRKRRGQPWLKDRWKC